MIKVRYEWGVVVLRGVDAARRLRRQTRSRFLMACVDHFHPSGKVSGRERRFLCSGWELRGAFFLVFFSRGTHPPLRLMMSALFLYFVVVVV